MNFVTCALALMFLFRFLFLYDLDLDPDSAAHSCALRNRSTISNFPPPSTFLSKCKWEKGKHEKKLPSFVDFLFSVEGELDT
jgi:hypothetical protein